MHQFIRKNASKAKAGPKLSKSISYATEIIIKGNDVTHGIRRNFHNSMHLSLSLLVDPSVPPLASEGLRGP